MKFETEPFSNEELENIYGKRKEETGKCYKSNGHFFKQIEDGVVHINTNDRILINILHEGFLNHKRYKEIEESEFDQQLCNCVVLLSSYIKQ